MSLNQTSEVDVIDQVNSSAAIEEANQKVSVIIVDTK